MEAIIFWILAILMVAFVLAIILIPLLRSRAGFSVILMLLIGLPLGIFSAYHYWGSFNAWQHYFSEQAASARVERTVEQMGGTAGVIAALSQRLQQTPNQPQGWFLLGKLYLSDNQIEPAIAALMRANQLQPNQPMIMTTLAEAIFVEHHRRLTTPAKNLLKNSLKIAPNNIEAMHLLALNAYLGAHYQTAIQYWEKMIPYFDPKSNDGKQLFSLIHQAQEKLRL